MTKLTTLEIREGIAWITMDDGKVNAMSAAMLEEVASRLDAAEAAGAVTVLAGREGIFSAGFDMGVFKCGAEATQRMVDAGVRLIERMLTFPLPIVVACTGHAYPMGAFLMLSADVRFGVAGDCHIGMNEVAIGISVPEFAIALGRYRLTPAAFARITTATMFAPQEALAAGYLDHVVEPAELYAAVENEAKVLQRLDMACYRVTKARVNEQVLAAIRSAPPDITT